MIYRWDSKQVSKWQFKSVYWLLWRRQQAVLLFSVFVVFVVKRSLSRRVEAFPCILRLLLIVILELAPLHLEQANLLADKIHGPKEQEALD